MTVCVCVSSTCNTHQPSTYNKVCVGGGSIGHDHVEETIGYEHIVEVMSALLETMRPEKTPHYHFCADTLKK